MSCRAEQKKRSFQRWRCTIIATTRTTTTAITTATAITTTTTTTTATSNGPKSWLINLEVNPKARTALKKKEQNLKLNRNKNTNQMPRTTNNGKRPIFDWMLESIDF